MFQHQQYQRATFENYIFQIPPKLCFEKDGNEQYGENLFVYDPQEKYLISFESGMPCFDLRYRGNPNYRSEEYGEGQIKINLCYPQTSSKVHGSMVYFHVELPDAEGNMHSLPGQMNISSGNGWSLESKNILMELLRSIGFNNIRSACWERGYEKKRTCGIYCSDFVCRQCHLAG